MNRIIDYKHADLSTGSVSIKIFEDAEQGLHHVIRRLPPGMDIAPEVWRFTKSEDALRQFDLTCDWMQRQGFCAVREVAQ